jgi:hypothetical protein
LIVDGPERRIALQRFPDAGGERRIVELSRRIDVSGAAGEQQGHRRQCNQTVLH